MDGAMFSNAQLGCHVTEMAFNMLDLVSNLETYEGNFYQERPPQ